MLMWGAGGGGDDKEGSVGAVWIRESRGTK